MHLSAPGSAGRTSTIRIRVRTGRRAFGVAAATLWRTLPVALCESLFSAIQKTAGTKALYGFRTLGSDGRAQQTTYEGGLTITANFGTADQDGVGAGCVVAQGGGLKTTTLCL